MPAVAFLVLAVVLVGWVLLAFRTPADPLVAGREGRTRRIHALEQEKQNYLRAIRDVEFERATGKLSDRDYQDLRDYYTRKAAEAIRALEALEGKAGRA